MIRRKASWRMVIILIIMSCFSLNAVAQTVTGNFNSQPLRSVLKNAEEQTGLSIIYDVNDIDETKIVNVSCRKTPVVDFLKKILGDEVDIILQDKIIILKKKNPNIQSLTSVDLKGIVIDNNGNPIVGAGIFIAGTDIGTLSGLDGAFFIPEVDVGKEVVVSFIGFKPLTLYAGKDNFENITLYEDTVLLDDVVVVGYSQKSREKLMSSVSTINSEKLVQSSVPNLENALSGKVSGVFSRQSSGEPGNDNANLTIRGFGQALIVVDGIPGRNFGSISPEEIESISVLKDASAASVYGMQGANGVIVVTTKRGARDKKTSIDVNAKYGLQMPCNYPQAASTELWQTLVNEYNSNLKLINNRNAVITADDIVDRDYDINTNWYDEIIRNAPMVQANMRVSGGKKGISYFIFGGYMYQGGIWSTNSTSSSRFNLRANLDFDFFDNFKASLNVSTIVNSNKYPGSSSDMIARNIKQTAPNIPVRWEEHEEYYAFGGEGTYNPVALADSDASGYQHTDINTTNFDFILEYKAPFLKGLSAKAVVAYMFSNSLDKNWFINPVYMGYKPDSGEYYMNAAYSNTNKASLSLGTSKTSNITSQFFLNYINNFGKHSVNSGLVFEIIEENYHYFSTSRGNFPSTVVDMLTAGNAENQITNTESQRKYRSASLIGHFSYDYASKYFVDFNFRYDGAQYFAEKWGFFPSVSLGWMLTNEGCMESSKRVLDEFKIRISWGKLGDLSAAKSYYAASEQYYYQSGYNYPGVSMTFGDRTIYGVSPTLNPNMAFTWSTSQMVNAGIDFQLWKGHLSGSVDAFYRKRDGLPAQKANDNAGALATWYNLNGDNTRGVEFSLNHAHSVGHFSYNIGANLSWSRTRSGYVESMPWQNGYSEWKWHSQGRWTNVRWGLKCIGRYESYEDIDNAPIHKDSNNNAIILPGDLKYEDWNKDGYIDEYDYRPIERTAYPELMYGLNFNFKYRNFDLTMFFQGAGLCSFEISAFDKDAFMEGRTNMNTWKYFEDRWHKSDYTDPSSAWIPGYFPAIRDMNTPTINRLPSDFWYFDGSYVRLKNLEFGYTFPSKWMNRAKIQSLRMYVSAYNLFTISSQKYFDPEQRESYESFASYPQIKSFSVGLNINF